MPWNDSPEDDWSWVEEVATMNTDSSPPRTPRGRSLSPLPTRGARFSSPDSRGRSQGWGWAGLDNVESSNRESRPSTRGRGQASSPHPRAFYYEPSCTASPPPTRRRRASSPHLRAFQCQQRSPSSSPERSPESADQWPFLLNAIKAAPSHSGIPRMRLLDFLIENEVSEFDDYKPEDFNDHWMRMKSRLVIFAETEAKYSEGVMAEILLGMMLRIDEDNQGRGRGGDRGGNWNTEQDQRLTWDDDDELSARMGNVSFEDNRDDENSDPDEEDSEFLTEGRGRRTYHVPRTHAKEYALAKEMNAGRRSPCQATINSLSRPAPTSGGSASSRRAGRSWSTDRGRSQSSTPRMSKEDAYNHLLSTGRLVNNGRSVKDTLDGTVVFGREGVYIPQAGKERLRSLVSALIGRQNHPVSTRHKKNPLRSALKGRRGRKITSKAKIHTQKELKDVDGRTSRKEVVDNHGKSGHSPSKRTRRRAERASGERGGRSHSSY